MRMHREGELGGSAGSLDHPQEPRGGGWRPLLRYEHVGARSLQWPQGSQLGAVQRMHTLNPALGPVHVQPPVPKIDLRPAKLAQLGRAEAMSIRK